MEKPNFSIENSLIENSGVKNLIICGIDEVGRGPLAGPVVAAAVILPRNLPDTLKNQINDSKKLSHKKRAVIAIEIQKIAQIGIGKVSVEEIDKINILQATMKAMQQAFDNLSKITAPDYALVDGNKAPDLPCPIQTVIKGDQHSLSIAAASIVAKEYRDTLMKDLGKLHPEYKWENNAGYGTKVHIEALNTYGTTIHHRRSFSPVLNVLLKEKNTTN